MLVKSGLLLVAFGVYANACSAPLLGDAVHYWASQGRNYLYVLLPSGATPGAGWQLPSFDHSSWLEGETVFSLVTDLEGGWPERRIRTDWPAGTDLFLFRTFDTKRPDVAPRSMTAEIAVSGGYELYLNGVLVSAGATTGPAMHWNFTVAISPAYYGAGENILAIRALGAGETPSFDFTLWSVPEPGTRWLLFTGAGLLGLLRAYTISSRRGSHFTLRSWR